MADVEDAPHLQTKYLGKLEHQQESWEMTKDSRLGASRTLEGSGVEGKFISKPSTVGLHVTVAIQE